LSCTVTDETTWVAGTAVTPGTAISAVVCATGAFYKASATFGPSVESCRSCSSDTSLKAGDGAATIFG